MTPLLIALAVAATPVDAPPMPPPDRAPPVAYNCMSAAGGWGALVGGVAGGVAGAAAVYSQFPDPRSFNANSILWPIAGATCLVGAGCGWAIGGFFAPGEHMWTPPPSEPADQTPTTASAMAY